MSTRFPRLLRRPFIRRRFESRGGYIGARKLPGANLAVSSQGYKGARELQVMTKRYSEKELAEKDLKDYLASSDEEDLDEVLFRSVFVCLFPSRVQPI